MILGGHPRTALLSQNRLSTRLSLGRKTTTLPATPSPPLPSSLMSIQTLTRRQHGRRSHLYGMFRGWLRGHRPTHRLPTTRLRNSILSSTIQRAHITAEAAAVKVKRAIDRVVTLTATSTQAGASKARRDLWVSQAPDERLVQTRSVYGLQSREAVHGNV